MPDPTPTWTPYPTPTWTPTPTPQPTPTPPPTATPGPTPTPSPTPPQPTPGPEFPSPAAYYDCQCPRGLRDISGNWLEFDESGSPGVVVGKCHDGRSVSSGNWFGRSSAAAFNPGSSGPLTIAMWFKPASLSGTQVLFEKAGEYQATLKPAKSPSASPPLLPADGTRSPNSPAAFPPGFGTKEEICDINEKERTAWVNWKTPFEWDGWL